MNARLARRLAWWVGLVFIVLLGYYMQGDTPERLDSAGGEDRNRGAFAAILGGIRTSMSDMMFVKTERYLHGGVAYVEPDHDDEAEAHIEHAMQPDSDHDHDPHHHDHRDIQTVIPTAERDFRLGLGWLHRQVKPWRDPLRQHVHTDGRELIPWFKAMTISDPHYIRGYMAGSFWLQSESSEEALAFIEDGLVKNPESFQLYVARGLLRIKTARRINEANPSLELKELALADFLRASELALAERPVGLTDEELDDDPAWGKYKENDALAACTMAIVLLQELGFHDEARDRGQQFLRIFPDHVPLQQAIHRGHDGRNSTDDQH